MKPDNYMKDYGEGKEELMWKKRYLRGKGIKWSPSPGKTVKEIRKAKPKAKKRKSGKKKRRGLLKKIKVTYKRLRNPTYADRMFGVK